MHDDKCPVLRIEAGEGPLDQVAVREAAGVVAGGRFVDGLELDLDGPSPRAAQLVEAGIHEKAMEPGVEPLGITKSRQVTPGSHQGVLDRIARELAVPEDQARGRVQPG